MLTAPSGRPVVEGSLPLDIKKELTANGVLFDTTTSKTPGSRFGRKINTPALVEISRGKKEIYDGFAWIHTNYFDGETPQDVTIKQTRDLANIAASLPTYLTRKAKNPIEPPLPDVIGHMYKSAEGIGRATLHMMKTMEPDTIVTAEQIYTHAEDNGVLLSGSGACAAADTFIIKTIDVLQRRTEGDQQQSNLNRYITDDEFPIIQNFSKARDAFLRSTTLYHDRKTAFMLHAIETGATEDDAFFETLLAYEDKQEGTLGRIRRAHYASARYLGIDEATIQIPTAQAWDSSLTNLAVVGQLEEYPEQYKLLTAYGIIQ